MTKLLTAREARFIEAYRLHGKAAQAAREAGYSARRAHKIGSLVLRRPKIITALREYGIEIVVPPPGEKRNYIHVCKRNGLTLLQERFVYQYLIDGNASQAARRAGLPGKNSAHAGSAMLHQPQVAAAIERERALAASRLTITAERVLSEFACLAFSDIRAMADWGPDGVVLKDEASLSREDRAAIAEVSSETEEKTGVVRSHVRLHSKQKALDALAKHLGLYGRGARTIDHAAEEARQRAAREELRARLKRIAAGEDEGAADAVEKEKEKKSAD